MLLSRRVRYCWNVKPGSMTQSPAGSFTGSIRHITASIRLKMAVFAPIPSARESATDAVKPGLFPKTRTA